MKSKLQVRSVNIHKIKLRQSEVFNEIIQNSPKWIRIFKTKTMGYPEHGKIVKKLAKKYYKHNIIELDQIIGDSIKEVKKINLLGSLASK